MNVQAPRSRLFDQQESELTYRSTTDSDTLPPLLHERPQGPFSLPPLSVELPEHALPLPRSSTITETDTSAAHIPHREITCRPANNAVRDTSTDMIDLSVAPGDEILSILMAHYQPPHGSPSVVFSALRPRNASGTLLEFLLNTERSRTLLDYSQRLADSLRQDYSQWCTAMGASEDDEQAVGDYATRILTLARPIGRLRVYRSSSTQEPPSESPLVDAQSCTRWPNSLGAQKGCLGRPKELYLFDRSTRAHLTPTLSTKENKGCPMLTSDLVLFDRASQAYAEKHGATREPSGLSMGHRTVRVGRTRAGRRNPASRRVPGHRTPSTAASNNRSDMGYAWSSESAGGSLNRRAGEW